MLDRLKSNLLYKIRKLEDSEYNQDCVYREKLHKTLSKNNVLLIGNGFDLALGKLSSYQDFLLYLFLIKLYLQVNGDNLQTPLLECDKLFVRSKNLDHKIKCVVEIVKRKIESIKQDNKALSSLCNFFNEKGSFLELFSRVLFQEYYLDVNKYNDSMKDHLLDNELVLSFSDYLFNKYKIRRLTDLSQFTDLYNTNLEKCVEEFFKILFPDAKDKSSIYINGWLDVESLINFIVLPDEILENRFLQNKLSASYVSLLNRLNVALNIASASKIYNSLQSFTDQFCEFLALQDIGFITLGKSALASILEQYEITVNHELNDFFPFLNYVDEFCNTISSVIDFNYTLSSLSIFEDIYDYSQKKRTKFEIYHVNGCIYVDDHKYVSNNAIFGYTNTSQRQVNINAFKFEKRAQRQLKNVRSFDFDRLTHNRFNLMIFGHSCSPADKDIIYPLLSSPNLRFAIIFCHSTDAKLSIYKNLNDILGPEKLDHLTRQTTELNNRLIWAVLKDKKNEE